MTVERKLNIHWEFEFKHSCHSFSVEGVKQFVERSREYNFSVVKIRMPCRSDVCRKERYVNGASVFIGHIRELKNHNEVHDDDDVYWLGKDWNENVSFGGKKET